MKQVKPSTCSTRKGRRRQSATTPGAEAWPPVLTEGAPVAAGAARADLLGTSPRTGGSMQVTYAGHPLYYYVNEGKNEVRRHNVKLNGGLWLVVTPDGKPASV